MHCVTLEDTPNHRFIIKKFYVKPPINLIQRVGLYCITNQQLKCFSPYTRQIVFILGSYMDINYNAGVMITNLVAYLSGYYTVWFHPKVITNTLSIYRFK